MPVFIKMRALLLALAVACGAGARQRSSPPPFNLSNVFSSHQVLQRDAPVHFWGWASPAAASPPQTISLTWLDGAVYRSPPSDASGFWRLTAPAAPLRAVPFELSFLSDAGGGALMLGDLLLGDVHACLGQSNVGAVQVKDMANASEMVSAAASLSTLRLYQVSGNAQSPTPLREFPADGLVQWQTPLAGGSNATLLGFSAVCFIAGTTLHSEYLGGAVPLAPATTLCSASSAVPRCWRSSRAARPPRPQWSRLAANGSIRSNCRSIARS
jgi:hypothetical protein